MNKTVLITGSSRGIGQAAAELFARHGYNVILNYFQSRVDAVELAQRLEKDGHAVLVCQADVSRRDDVEAMVQSGLHKFGAIDVLVNNAGVSGQKLFTELAETEWDHMFAVNMKGVFHCCQCVLPAMIARRAGKIINVSSVWGITGASCEVHYSAAKAAVIGFTKALAKELGPSNIQVNCVAPGVISTAMNAELDEEARRLLLQETPLMRFGTAEEAAHAIFYLASEQADFITGQVLSPNGGLVI